ncbi:MAG TPA: acyl-CoA dehydrogenase family protein [Anaerovoracaceae bacterium]|nr:acyl-CoA dehydrogenase family protein [Anaerovoracaceae bacterium]
MNIHFTEEQRLLQEALRDFAKSEVAPNAAKWDEEDRCPTELFPLMGELGILGIFVPEEYGGVGLGHTERVMALEEIARYSGGLAMFIFTHQLGIAAILEYGSEEQKKKYLPELCAGTKIGGLAVTEPGGGSDVAGQTTTAELIDGRWVINGRKCFITNSHIADLALITAKTGKDGKGRNLFSILLIEKGTKGFAPGRKEHKIGLRGSVTGDLVMNNAEIPEENLVGRIGEGTSAALKTIGEVGRASMTAICVGILRGCVEESVKFANERIEYGKPISKLQAIQFHIAENRVDYEAARALLYKAVTLKDEGVQVTTEFSTAKYFATEAAARASKRTIELMGGYGNIKEYPAERFLRDSIASIASGGTSEIQKIIVAGDTIKNFS